MDTAKLLAALTLELLGRNRAPLHFKTKTSQDRLARIVILTNSLLDSPELGGYFPVPGTLN